jgi:hypothetical protein
MKRWLRIAIPVGTLALLLGAAAAAPSGLRRMDSFRVRRVEVRGTHYLPPHEALSATGITLASSVFDDFAPWRDSLERHPLVKNAVVERQLPGTIRIFIEESAPIALAQGEGKGKGEGDADAGRRAGELVPINAAGEILPIDPSLIDLDLPIIAVPASASPASASATASPSPQPSPSPLQTVLRVLTAIQVAEPAMYGWISDAEQAGNAVRIHLRSPARAVALIPNDPEPAQLRKLRLTLADLAARQDITRLIRIDARYHDQVVVTLAHLDPRSVLQLSKAVR